MHDAGQAATKQASGWLQGSQTVSDLASLRSSLSPGTQRLELAGARPRNSQNEPLGRTLQYQLGSLAEHT